MTSGSIGIGRELGPFDRTTLIFITLLICCQVVLIKLECYELILCNGALLPSVLLVGISRRSPQTRKNAKEDRLDAA